jgi:hypothetical protein
MLLNRIMNCYVVHFSYAYLLIASAPALAGVSQVAWDFEQRSSSNNGISGWFFTRGADLDNGKGLVYRGQGNAWVRNTTGWNAINNWVSYQLR